MRLAPDGVSPGPPDGIALTSYSVLAPYVGLPTLQLSFQMGSGFQFTTFPWDWRRSILAAGDTLAGQIRAQVSPSQPCAIVAHSAGGLVARRAWSNLVGTSQQGLVRRIVTLGTPHYGTYYAAQSFQGQNQFSQDFVQWNQVIGGILGGLPPVLNYTSWTLIQVQQLLATWPALYELLPQLGAPDAADDPNRAALYSASSWPPAIGIQQAWLDHAAQVFTPWSLSAAAQVPDNVLVAVAGGYATGPDDLTSVSGFAAGYGVGVSNDSDGVVTRASAQPIGSTAFRVTSQHMDLYPQAVGNGNMAYWLTLTLSPSPTPQPEVLDLGSEPVTLPFPPGMPTAGSQRIVMLPGGC